MRHRSLFSHAFVTISLLSTGVVGAYAAGNAPEKSSITLPVYADSATIQKSCYALEHAYQALGIVVKFVDMPAASSLVESNAGNVGGEILRTSLIEATYPNLLRVNVLMYVWSVSTVTRSDRMAPTLAEAAIGGQVGIVRGIRTAENATQGWTNVIVVNSYSSAVRMLKAGRIDILLGGTDEIREAMHGEQLMAKDVRFKEVMSIPLYHYLHTSKAALVPAIGAELARIKGKYATVLDGLNARPGTGISK